MSANKNIDIFHFSNVFPDGSIFSKDTVIYYFYLPVFFGSILGISS